ncbi:MAG: AmmeMemoRadiSam system protein A [Calditrichaceae bacterium]
MTKSYDINLSNEEKKYLLQTARQVIASEIKGLEANFEAHYSDGLNTKTGVFVTIKIHEELRGCIGYIKGYSALVESVRKMAISAAFHDPRFNPISESELSDAEIEISVLSPMIRVKNLTEIEVGRDGLLIRRLPHEGLLLPQVATEYNWSRETLLNQTCLKANIDQSAWKDPITEIYRFSAVIFKESDFQNSTRLS